MVDNELSKSSQQVHPRRSGIDVSATMRYVGVLFAHTRAGRLWLTFDDGERWPQGDIGRASQPLGDVRDGRGSTEVRSSVKLVHG